MAEGEKQELAQQLELHEAELAAAQKEQDNIRCIFLVFFFNCIFLFFYL